MGPGGSVVMVSSVTAYGWAGGAHAVAVGRAWRAQRWRKSGAAVLLPILVGPRTQSHMAPPPWHPPQAAPRRDLLFARTFPCTHTCATPRRPRPPFPIAYYAVSKTALLGLVKGLAAEMGPAGIRVNGVVRATRRGVRRVQWLAVCAHGGGCAGVGLRCGSCAALNGHMAQECQTPALNRFSPPFTPLLKAPGIVPTKFSAALVADAALERAQVRGVPVLVGVGDCLSKRGVRCSSSAEMP